jgi:hypothetical protein
MWKSGNGMWIGPAQTIDEAGTPLGSRLFGKHDCWAHYRESARPFQQRFLASARIY